MQLSSRRSTVLENTGCIYPLFFGSLLSTISSTALFAFLSCNSVKDDALGLYSPRAFRCMPNVGSDALPSSFFLQVGFNSAILLSQSRETALTYTCSQLASCLQCPAFNLGLRPNLLSIINNGDFKIGDSNPIRQI